MPNSIKNLKILVTGGAGFVGSHIVDELVKKGAAVTILDNLETGKKENLKDRLNSIKFIKGSVINYRLVRSLIRKSEIVFHLAVHHMTRSIEHPEEDFRTNALGTFNVLRAAKESRHIRKIVYTSSVSIYGNSPDLPFTEKTYPCTLSPYAAHKLAGEFFCKAFYESYGLPIAVLRYSNVYGPRQTSGGYGGVVSRFFASAMNKKPLLVYGDGKQTRDFVYIEDAVDATMRIMDSPKTPGQILNIGTMSEISINELAKKIADLYPHPLKISHIRTRAVDNIRRRVLSNQEIKKMLGWSPSHSLENGLLKTKDWFERNREHI